uniref:PiggyBac transposable element-derived protein domain-containing protein n=1 Tax=Glossina austeni TaxID=7395 RepID=A0A1A9UGH8_GLOAU
MLRMTDLFGKKYKKRQWSQRLKTDKFAMVSTIWNIFIENSQNCYRPGCNITIDEQPFPTKCLLESVSYYNNTKFGADMTDQMARKFTTKSNSCRWPLEVCFNILDLAGINVWILYKQTTGENISRQDFLLKLAVEFAADFREARGQPKANTNMKRSLPKSTTDANERKRCQIGYCKDNKTNKICSKCEKYVCGRYRCT